MIAEAVERRALRHSTDERTILALIEKRSGLLSTPGRGQISDAVLAHLHLVGNVAEQQLDGCFEPFLRSQRDIVSRQNPRRRHEVTQGFDDLVAISFESRAHHLHDEPSIVPIDDE